LISTSSGPGIPATPEGVGEARRLGPVFLSSGASPCVWGDAGAKGGAWSGWAGWCWAGANGESFSVEGHSFSGCSASAWRRMAGQSSG